MIPIPTSATSAWVALADRLTAVPPVPCSTTSDPEAWWLPADDQGPRALAARSACEPCPARDACLAYALAAGEQHGTWGGWTAGDRARLRNVPA